jgi:hypothetical protein
MIKKGSLFTKLAVVALFLPAGLFADAGTTKVGTYSVPTTPELAPLASFPNTYQIKKTDEGDLTIDYNLPEDLVGSDPIAIHLEGTVDPDSDDFVMKSPEGFVGDCHQQDAAVNCHVSYYQLRIDAAKTDNFLDNKYKTKPDLGLRKQIARAFDVEPRGIVNY